MEAHLLFRHMYDFRSDELCTPSWPEAALGISKSLVRPQHVIRRNDMLTFWYVTSHNADPSFRIDRRLRDGSFAGVNELEWMLRRPIQLPLHTFTPTEVNLVAATTYLQRNVRRTFRKFVWFVEALCYFTLSHDDLRNSREFVQMPGYGDVNAPSSIRINCYEIIFFVQRMLWIC